MKSTTPGPGTYRPPSDFGYLDFKPKTGYFRVHQKDKSSILEEANYRSGLVSIIYVSHDLV